MIFGLASLVGNIMLWVIGITVMGNLLVLLSLIELEPLPIVFYIFMAAWDYGLFVYNKNK